MIWPRRRHRELDARIEQAEQAADRATAELADARARYERVRARVIEPLRQKDTHNRFADLARRTIIEGDR